eukprot:8463633-Lingulodinium_polyedra.AAC.1
MLPANAFSTAVCSEEVSRLPPSVFGCEFECRFFCSDLAPSQHWWHVMLRPKAYCCCWHNSSRGSPIDVPRPLPQCSSVLWMPRLPWSWSAPELLP